MSHQWSRADDARIAEQCEGLTVRRWDELGYSQRSYNYAPEEMYVGPSIHDRLAHYNTDPAAALRAAEAWRKQKPGRQYNITSALGEYPAEVELVEDYATVLVATAPTLHEALLAACEKEEPE